jgi:hypothetical protein
MNLTDAVENATRLAGQEDMIDPIMVVHHDGLDKKYEKEGLVECRLDFAV